MKHQEMLVPAKAGMPNFKVLSTTFTVRTAGPAEIQTVYFQERLTGSSTTIPQYFLQRPTENAINFNSSKIR
jgi:hypothetical protein